MRLTWHLCDVEKTQRPSERLAATIGQLTTYSIDNSELSLNRRHIRHDPNRKAKRSKIMSLINSQANVYMRNYCFIPNQTCQTCFVKQRAIRLQLHCLKTRHYRQQPKRRSCVLCNRRYRDSEIVVPMDSHVRAKFITEDPSHIDIYKNAIDGHKKCMNISEVKKIIEARPKCESKLPSELLVELQLQEKANNQLIDNAFPESLFRAELMKGNVNDVLKLTTDELYSINSLKNSLLQACAKKFLDSVEGKITPGIKKYVADVLEVTEKPAVETVFLECVIGSTKDKTAVRTRLDKLKVHEMKLITLLID